MWNSTTFYVEDTGIVYQEINRQQTPPPQYFRWEIYRGFPYQNFDFLDNIWDFLTNFCNSGFWTFIGDFLLYFSTFWIILYVWDFLTNFGNSGFWKFIGDFLYIFRLFGYRGFPYLFWQFSEYVRYQSRVWKCSKNDQKLMIFSENLTIFSF